MNFIYNHSPYINYGKKGKENTTISANMHKNITYIIAILIFHQIKNNAKAVIIKQNRITFNINLISSSIPIHLLIKTNINAIINHFQLVF